MAYQQTQSTANTRSSASASSAGAGARGTRKEPLFKTGLFKSTKPGVKAMASVQVAEAITIPAGSYINLYANDFKKTDSHPDFKLTVTEGVRRSARN